MAKTKLGTRQVDNNAIVNGLSMMGLSILSVKHFRRCVYLVDIIFMSIEAIHKRKSLQWFLIYPFCITYM